MGNKFFGCTAALSLAFATGCNKSAPPAPSAPPPASAALPADTIVRIHWLGRNRLTAETNAAAFMRIWQRPESARLESQTIKKLALSPWRLLYGNAKVTNAPSALLEPLLEDVVRFESYLEMRQPPNQATELAFAIRLNDQRARLWETNLGGVLELLSGNSTVSNSNEGSRLRLVQRGPGFDSFLPRPLAAKEKEQPRTSESIQLLRAGEWSVVGLAYYSNALAADFVARISRDHAPFAARATNFWLEADLDLQRLEIVLPLVRKLAIDISKFAGTIIGDGENVRTRAEISLARPISGRLTPWAIPTNLIQSPLISLTMAREITPVLKKFKPFGDLPVGFVPDQLYLWGRGGPPLKMFFALRGNEAAKSFGALTEPITNWVNSRVSPERFGSISLEPNASRLKWNGLPFASPFLQAVTNSGQQYLFGGLGLHYFAQTNSMPPELLTHILEGANLVYFDWEHTGEKIVHWRYFDDASRIIFDAAHLPRFRDDSASLGWIASISTNLSHAVTEVRLAGPGRLEFARKSAFGLSALEIDFLANWLDLPEFPLGLDTILRTNSTPRSSRPKR